MANARSIINQAARKIAVLGRGQTLSADEYQDALTNLNALVSFMSTDVGLIFNNAREVFPLTGAVSYTIGASGVFDTVKPFVINSAFIRIGNIDYHLKQIMEQEYSAIGFKSIGGIPELFYYKNDTPLGTIFVYPVGVAGYSLHLSSLKPLTEFADLSTEYDVPTGQEDMLVYNLAKRLAGEYEKPVPPEVNQMAEKTVQAMRVYNKRNNYPTSVIDMADNRNGIGNIYSGWWVR